MIRWRAFIGGFVVAAALTGTAVYGLDRLDRAFPPPLQNARVVSQELLDKDGKLLRAFATP